MKGPFYFLLIMFVLVFGAGFLVGYFSERTGMVYTQSEVERLSNQVDNMQLQEMFLTGEKVDCNLMYSTMGKVSWSLYDMVDRLKVTNPGTEEFTKLKRDADTMSLRAWIIARNIQQQCKSDIVPVLFLYSGYCSECQSQDAVLKKIKEKHPEVMVYAIDYDMSQDATDLVKAAYSISSTPSMIINHQLYGKLSEQELEAIICSTITCQDSGE
jgi:hypothetical protein